MFIVIMMIDDGESIIVIDLNSSKRKRKNTYHDYILFSSIFFSLSLFVLALKAKF